VRRAGALAGLVARKRGLDELGGEFTGQCPVYIAAQVWKKEHEGQTGLGALGETDA
jgi:hypothetical protein